MSPDPRRGAAARVPVHAATTAAVIAACVWVPSAIGAFTHLDAPARTRVTVFAVIMTTALAWLAGGPGARTLHHRSAPTGGPGARTLHHRSAPTGETDEIHFRRWIEAQLEAGQDRGAAAQRLRPAWEAWRARDRIDEQARARHEAAHAVVAHSLGHTILSADIRHAGDRGGRVESVPPLPSRGAGPDLWDALTITVAGNVLDLAEGRHNISSRDDIRAAETIAAAMISTGHAPDPDAPPRTIARAADDARARANWILITHKSQVNALAAALIERRALTGRQVHDLLRPERP